MPSEDLKTRKISCNLGQNKELKEVEKQKGYFNKRYKWWALMDNWSEPLRLDTLG